MMLSRNERAAALLLAAFLVDILSCNVTARPATVSFISLSKGQPTRNVVLHNQKNVGYHHHYPIIALHHGSSVRPIAKNTRRFSVLFSDAGFGFDGVSLPLVAVVALGLGLAAQGWINTMLKGDDGLGAYLKDGSGYQKSAFINKQKEKQEDPMPWLSLPKLDFVEVAGQRTLEQQLEMLRKDMNQALEAGDIEQATQKRQELEQLCQENGFEYQTDEN